MQTTLATASEWAEVEFGGADLGDKRRGSRLIRLARAVAQKPHGTLPGSLSGWAETKAAYRLLEESDVTYDGVIAPHRGRVREACGRPGEYLMVEDTTSLGFTSHLAARDMGRISNDAGRGLWVHSTLALRIERWNSRQEPEVTAEGLFDQRWWARTEPTGRKRRAKRQKLSQPRESERWAAVAQEVGSPPDGAQWTLLADRESDIYETFLRCQENRWHFILRAGQPRALAQEDGSVFTAVSEGRELGRFTLDIRARPGQSARQAVLVVRSRPVVLRPPWRPGVGLKPCTLNVVEAQEIDAPQGVEPIRWVLLTDWPCERFESAMRVVKAYACRWLIEQYHKCLKSGTGVEQSQLSTAHHITALLGILAVVAVRLLNMKLLATHCPDQPIHGDQLDPAAMAILEAHYGQPPGGWTHQTLLVGVARMGGFLARRGDGSPGWLTIWRGWDKLTLLAQGFELARSEKCG